MAPSPVSPSPVVGSISVSGGAGDWTVSGQSPASGVPSGSVVGVFSGPHFIEEQTLSIDYFRYPQIQFQSVSPQDMSLSATFPISTVASGSVWSTKLALKLIASVKITKSYDRFSTSSFQQPQKFEVLAASADALGNTYGAVPQGSLGPAGSIRTSQKFYNRRPWDSTDAETNETLNGGTVFYQASSIPNSVGGRTYIPRYTSTRNPDFFYGQYWTMDNTTNDKYPEISNNAFGYMGAPDGIYVQNIENDGGMIGPYLAANDQTTLAQDILETQGRHCSNGQFLHDWTIATTGSTMEHATGALSLSSVYYCPSYDVSRHDYT